MFYLIYLILLEVEFLFLLFLTIFLKKGICIFSFNQRICHLLPQIQHLRGDEVQFRTDFRDFIQDFLGFCANGVTGAFQLPEAPGRQVGRGQGGLGLASPISCILGGSSATHTTVATIEAITGQS